MTVQFEKRLCVDICHNNLLILHKSKNAVINGDWLISFQKGGENLLENFIFAEKSGF